MYYLNFAYYNLTFFFNCYTFMFLISDVYPPQNMTLLQSVHIFWLTKRIFLPLPPPCHRDRTVWLGWGRRIPNSDVLMCLSLLGLPASLVLVWMEGVLKLVTNDSPGLPDANDSGQEAMPSWGSWGQHRNQITKLKGLPASLGRDIHLWGDRSAMANLLVGGCVSSPSTGMSTILDVYQFEHGVVQRYND